MSIDRRFNAYAEKRVLLRNNDQIVEHIENLLQLERGVL